MNAKTRGQFIVFEGPDGCGKSTQLERLAAAFEAAGTATLRTREPTDGSWGRRIRQMLAEGEVVSPEQELDWFSRDRSEHVRNEIAPALAKGRHVLCDRYFLSTVCYQGAHGLDWRELLASQEALFPAPDLALVFVLDAREAQARIAGRVGTAEPAFEERAFQERVAAVYAELDRPYIVRVDAAGDVDAVAARVAECVRIALA